MKIRKVAAMNEYKPEGSLIKTERNYQLLSSKSGLDRALEGQIILEAPVVLCDHNFDLHVELGAGVKGLMPRDEVEYSLDGETAKDIAILTRVGKTVCFKVIGFKNDSGGTPTAILSRRAAQRECVNNYLNGLYPGDIIPAKVTHLEPFGAFCDIGCGIIALMPIDAISVSRISHPSDRFSPGDSIKAVVKSIDQLGRVSLSQRELLGTWEENAAEFLQGETVEGIVRTVEDYGIFIELAPNLAGLAEPREDVDAGQKVSVYIKSIIKEKMKLKLIIIDVFDAEKRESPIKYFINSGHIDHWQYSPDGCSKTIETQF